MKKVLFVATVPGHINAFHLPYLKYFKEEGYEVHVASSRNDNLKYCDKNIIIPIKRSPYKLSNIKAIKELKKIIDNEKYEIIHCHTPMGGVVARLAAKKARKNGTRVIYTAHGFHFFKGAPILNWLLFYPIEKILSKYTDTLITINNEDYELAKKKFKINNIEYVPGVGVDLEKFKSNLTEEEKKKLRKSLNLNEKDFIMIYTARLDKNKNQIFLIKMMKKLIQIKKNIHLLLVGPDELNGEYQNITKKYNLEENIHFLGFRKDVNKLLQISNLAVSSSLREGLPVNIIEAICSDVPVIALRCRGMEDLINEKNGFIVDNEEEFIKKIELLYTKKIKTKKDSKIIEKIKSENIIKKMIAIYKVEI